MLWLLRNARQEMVEKWGENVAAQSSWPVYIYGSGMNQLANRMRSLGLLESAGNDRRDCRVSARGKHILEEHDARLTARKPTDT
jgi:hypothetical protein